MVNKFFKINRVTLFYSFTMDGVVLKWLISCATRATVMSFFVDNVLSYACELVGSFDRNGFLDR